MKKFVMCLFLGFLMVTAVIVNGHEEVEEGSDESEDGNEKAEKADDVNQEKLEYTRGSVCGYCTYCKFCKLCDKDCPCETSQSRPNCKMCKYCTYCYLCTALCDTVCTPGSILDRVSGTIINALPSFNKAEVDGDIISVKPWIDKKKDEL